MKAIHFGAGNIGRGFIGKVLADAGIHVTFADVNEAVVSELKTRQSYDVTIVGETKTVETVSNVTAINSMDPDIILLMTEVNLITTAVGPNVLPLIAKTIAEGIKARWLASVNYPLNIIACENMVRGTSQLRDRVFEFLTPEEKQYSNQFVGFVDSAVDRIVPPADSQETDVLAVMVESFSEWIVDETQFVGPVPVITGMEETNNLMAFVERKLLTLNTGHAITAYLGNLAKYQTIKDAISDANIREKVIGAMEESGGVLLARYGFNKMAHFDYIKKIIKRFENPYLRDEIARVAREPIRKLGKEDRLIKPLLGTLHYGLENDCLIQGIAALFHYQNPQDPQAVTLQQQLEEMGFEKTLAHYSELEENSLIVKKAKAAYISLN